MRLKERRKRFKVLGLSIQLCLCYRQPCVGNNTVSQDGIIKWLKFQQASVTFSKSNLDHK